MILAVSDKNEDFASPPLGAREYAAWLALARVKGLSCAGFKKLADHLSDASKALDASEKELAQIPGLDKRAIYALDVLGMG